MGPGTEIQDAGCLGTQKVRSTAVENARLVIHTTYGTIYVTEMDPEALRRSYIESNNVLDSMKL